MRIAMMGTGTFAEPAFEALLAAFGGGVVGLVTQPERDAGSKRGSTRQTGKGMANIAAASGVAVVQPESINTPAGLALLAAMRPDLLVVAAYGQILSREVLAVPARGVINVHASLLPKFRGAAPVAYAILSGDAQTGVTIIKVTPGLDSGDMILQAALDILPSDTTGSLEARLAQLGARMAVEAARMYATGGSVEGAKQDPALVTRAPKIKKEFGLIDWTKPAEYRQYRTIPVGYSAADVQENRLEMAEFMNCGTDDERSDFFAFNDYSWCDPSSFETSGWDQKVKNFTGYGLPLFLSEYGCNTNERKFEEVASLYSTDMTGVYSGGLVYEYSQEDSHYGLVEVSSDSVSELPDFDALMQAFSNTANPQGDGGYNSTGGASGCPAYSPPNWNVKGDALPAIPEGAKKYMTEGAGKGPGLSGEGSQNAGGASTGTASAGSGQATTTGSAGSSESNAAGHLTPSELSLAPFLCAGVVAMSTLFCATML